MRQGFSLFYVRGAAYSSKLHTKVTVFSAVMSCGAMSTAAAGVLGVGRAIGEAMAVMMVAGNAPVSKLCAAPNNGKALVSPWVLSCNDRAQASSPISCLRLQTAVPVGKINSRNKC